MLEFEVLIGIGILGIIFFAVRKVNKNKVSRMSSKEYVEFMKHEGATLRMLGLYEYSVNHEKRWVNRSDRNIYVRPERYRFLLGEIVAERDVGESYVTIMNHKSKVMQVEFTVALAGMWKKIGENSIGRQHLEKAEFELIFAVGDEISFGDSTTKYVAQRATIIDVSL